MLRPRLGWSLLAIVVSLIAGRETAAGDWLLDPVLVHTHGMPLATTQPHRSASVDWCCNPDQLGQCGDHYYVPCIGSLLHGRHRACNCEGTPGAAPCNACRSGGVASCDAANCIAHCSACQRMHWQGASIAYDVVGYEGIEQPGDAILGEIPSTSGPVARLPPPAAVGPPSSGFQFSLPLTVPGIAPP